MKIEQKGIGRAEIVIRTFEVVYLQSPWFWMVGKGIKMSASIVSLAKWPGMEKYCW